MSTLSLRWPLLLSLVGPLGLAAQPNTPLPRPKLVVGIVVDQMRYDFLYRYWEKYSEQGFKRLLREGFSYSAAYYPYVPTTTAPGHASLYTGTTPRVHGIIGNSWYSRSKRGMLYCTEDSTQQAVGGSPESGPHSPRNLLATTLTDELRRATHYHNKVIGIALKDRGAILPAGHAANAAFWFDRYTGRWVTSSYYLSKLPSWVQAFNSKNLPDSMMGAGWKALLPLASYTESTADDMPYERPLPGNDKPTLPYQLVKGPGAVYEPLLSTPYGNELTLRVALAALAGEQLGKGSTTDFLAISFSSTDYVGHSFGPSSVETEDTYLRLDRSLAELLEALDRQVGKGKYLLFLSADHGAVDAPELGALHQLPGGRYDADALEKDLENYCDQRFGNADWVQQYSNQQVYLNAAAYDATKQAPAVVEDILARYLVQRPGVAQVYTREQLQGTIPAQDAVALGYNPHRSGDLVVTYEPQWFEGYEQDARGTTHGTQYSYDSHVPLLLFGWQQGKGSCARTVAITDLAPTLAVLLSIETPSGCTGNVLLEAVAARAGDTK